MVRARSIPGAAAWRSARSVAVRALRMRLEGLSMSKSTTTELRRPPAKMRSVADNDNAPPKSTTIRVARRIAGGWLKVDAPPAPGKPMPGVGPTVQTRECPSCHWALPLPYFRESGAGKCMVCADEEREARPWTTDQMAALLEAARGILDLWGKYPEQWSGSDLAKWRALLAATGRTPLSEAD